MADRPKVCPICGGDTTPKGRLTHEQLVTSDQQIAHSKALRLAAAKAGVDAAPDLRMGDSGWESRLDQQADAAVSLAEALDDDA